MRIQELDSLRGIAAIMVVMAHTTLILPKESNIFRLGVSGVDLFFIISGYVIYMTINKSKNLKDFWVARIGRLYPAYWFTLVYFFFLFFCWSKLTAMPQKFSFIDLIYNLTLFQHYFFVQDIILPAWTLLIEMLFYIFVAILFAAKFLRQVKQIIFIGILIVTIKIAISFFLPDFDAFVNYYLPIINHFPLFLTGILFYHINEKSYNLLNFLLILLCYLLQVSLFDKGGNKDFMNRNEYISILAFFYFLFFLNSINKLSFINNIVTQFLGKISYSLYLCHLSASSFLISFFTKTKFFQLDYWFVIVVIVLPYLMLSAYFIYKYIELPGIQITKKIRLKL